MHSLYLKRANTTTAIRDLQSQSSFVRERSWKSPHPLPYLCDDEYCYGSKDGRLLYFDDNHLSEYGNKLLVPMFERLHANWDISYG